MPEQVTPLYVVKELARIRETAVTNMLDRHTVEKLARDPRAREWLNKASDSQYINALHEMGRADSEDFLEDTEHDLDDEPLDQQYDAH